MFLKIRRSLLVFLSVAFVAAVCAFAAVFAARTSTLPVSAEEQDTHTHEITSIVITKEPTKKLGYKAFEKFDPAGMIVKTHCGTCDTDVETVTAGCSIVYANGECLRAGDKTVTVEYALSSEVKLTAKVSGITVAKLSVTVNWQYAKDAGNPDWGTWVRTVSYDPDTEGLKPNVRAVFTPAQNDPRDNVGTYRGTNSLVLAVKDGKEQASVKDVGQYVFSLDDSAAEFSDYSFINNSATLTVQPFEI